MKDSFMMLKETPMKACILVKLHVISIKVKAKLKLNWIWVIYLRKKRKTSEFMFSVQTTVNLLMTMLLKRNHSIDNLILTRNVSI